ncbi:telomere length regulation protein-domain-containing protein [Xylariaceae sp. FL0255]|nr:telomere length regulation protein-domain-containing protein [Xylariaceae sp. FL0255]
MEFLSPVSQTYRKATGAEELFSLSKTSSEPTKKPAPEFEGKSPEEALEALKNQPNYDTLISVLKYLRPEAKNESLQFDVRAPGPLNAQIIHVLVTEIVPNYWTVLHESTTRTDVKVLLACLRSLPGINASLAYLRALIREARSELKDLKNSHVALSLKAILDLLDSLLEDHGSIWRVWQSISPRGTNLMQLRPLRTEFITLLTSGRIISLSAEAEDICRQSGTETESRWIADSKLYVEWLARCLVDWSKSDPSEDGLKLCGEIGARAMRLGHPDLFMKECFINLLLVDDAGKERFNNLIANFPPLEQRKALALILKLLSDFYLNSADDREEREDYPTIWAAVNVIESMITKVDPQKSNLVTWLTSASGAGIGEPCGIRRAAVAALAGHKDSLVAVLEKSLNQFGDQLYIKHTPVLQQEAHAQVLLLSAGYLHRTAPMKLTILIRSSPYLNTISNRLAVSQTRTRFLGMVVGEALSGLVHGKDTKLDFKMEEMKTDEADWYKSLVNVVDKVGPLDPLKIILRSVQHKPSSKSTSKVKKPVPPKVIKAPPKTGFVIEEIEDDEGDQEDRDLVPYAKPDSDAEDSDDDPTLINRDKPKAPVYIRDLITYLRDVDNYDKQKLALATAPTLIRRKASYGTEVISHAEELATLLVGLQDKFELEDFDTLRLQGLVAIVVAQPKKMAPWFAKTFFDGDYSLSQRASVLITLGLGGREIAGFETSEYASAAQFPSKALPSKIEKHYLSQESNKRLQPGSHLKALPPNALDNVARSLSQTFLAPMAAEAADAATGPDALKLSSFTSRLQEQQYSPSPSSVSPKNKIQKTKKTGIRSIPNTTASLISTSFFFPLTSRFQAAMRYSSTSKILFQPYLLASYLKTLALLIHAAGPSTLALPQMTSELWDLILGVRGRCLGTTTSNSKISEAAEEGELTITHAVLMALAALLDVNENDLRGVCERHGREVVESTEWVSAVFNSTHGGDGVGGEENEVKMLAAGVLIRLQEAVEKYQAVLMGNLVGFT